MIIADDNGNGRTKVAWCDETGSPQVVLTDSGEKSWPSYVFKDNKGDVIVGEDARQQGICQPDQLAYGYKMYLGDKAKRFFAGTASGSDVLAMALPQFIVQAEKKSGHKVTGIVAVHPAVFHDDQKQGLLDAHAKAGIHVVQLMAEPEAAAYAYIWKDKVGRGRTYIYVCIDWGHGTLDVSVLEVKDGVAKAIWTEGILQLGGRDFIEQFKRIVLEKISKLIGKALPLDKLDPTQAGELHEKAEKGTHALSGQPSTKLALNFGGRPQLVEVTKTEFDAACAPFIARMKECAEKALKGAKKTWKDVHTLTLAGGVCQNRGIQEQVAEFSGLVPRTDIDPSSVVSFGAAIHARNLELMEVQKTQGGDGAAKGVLGDQPIFVTTTGHDVGICMIDKSSGSRKNVCWRMVTKGTAVPHTFTDMFKLERPNQTDVIIEILQGEHEAEASACSRIGSLHLSALPPEAHLSSRIEITFTFDSNAIVTVMARDKISGISKSVSVKLKDDKKAP